MGRSHLLLLVHLLLLGVALQWRIAGTGAFQSVVCAVPTALGMLSSKIRHMLWRSGLEGESLSSDPFSLLEIITEALQ